MDLYSIKAVGGLVKGRNGSYKIKDVGSKYECQVKQCLLATGCSHFTYIEDTKECYLKTANVLKELMHSDDRRDVTFGPHIYERMKTLYSIWSCVSLYRLY